MRRSGAVHTCLLALALLILLKAGRQLLDGGVRTAATRHPPAAGTVCLTWLAPGHDFWERDYLVDVLTRVHGIGSAAVYESTPEGTAAWGGCRPADSCALSVLVARWISLVDDCEES